MYKKKKKMSFLSDKQLLASRTKKRKRREKGDSLQQKVGKKKIRRTRKKEEKKKKEGNDGCRKYKGDSILLMDFRQRLNSLVQYARFVEEERKLLNSRREKEASERSRATKIFRQHLESRIRTKLRISEVRLRKKAKQMRRMAREEERKARSLMLRREKEERRIQREKLQREKQEKRRREREARSRELTILAERKRKERRDEVAARKREKERKILFLKTKTEEKKEKEKEDKKKITKDERKKKKKKKEKKNTSNVILMSRRRTSSGEATASTKITSPPPLPPVNPKKITKKKGKRRNKKKDEKKKRTATEGTATVAATEEEGENRRKEKMRTDVTSVGKEKNNKKKNKKKKKQDPDSLFNRKYRPVGQSLATTNSDSPSVLRPLSTSSDFIRPRVRFIEVLKIERMKAEREQAAFDAASEELKRAVEEHSKATNVQDRIRLKRRILTLRRRLPPSPFFSFLERGRERGREEEKEEEEKQVLREFEQKAGPVVTLSKTGKVPEGVLVEMLERALRPREKDPIVECISVDSCPGCGSEQVIHSVEDATMYCEQCGQYDQYIDATSSTIAYGDEVEYTCFVYRRKTHLKDFLNKFQAKESSNVPESVLARIMVFLHDRMGFSDPTEIEYYHIYNALHKLRMNRYYNHVMQIWCRITGKRPPRLQPVAEDKLWYLFDMFEKSFERHCPPGRKNFLSYQYIIYKFCQILGFDELLPFLTLLKGEDKLKFAEKVFETICDDIGLEFIPVREEDLLRTKDFGKEIGKNDHEEYN